MEVNNLDSLNYEQKRSIVDDFGKIVIEDVRDRALRCSMRIVKHTTCNPRDLERYGIFSDLGFEQQEKICDLLSETITDTIYSFLKMFEDHEEKMRLMLIHDDNEYDMLHLSADINSEIGSEITFSDEEGWIQKFSEIGRMVL